MSGDPHIMLDPTSASLLAIQLIKRAGFVLHTTSSKSEACYYRHPSRADFAGVLRMGLHKKKKPRWNGLNPVVSKVTIPNHEVSENHVFNLTANAIGRYFIADEPDSER